MKKLAVIGAGGNIGSHLVAHLARMVRVEDALLVLVDSDRYEEKNLLSQDLVPSECGQWKAEVQAARVRRIAPKIKVEAIVDKVQNLAHGQLYGDLMLACLDSRAARQQVNEVAWRLGVNWIDAGVAADGLLARVTVYQPDEASACLECAWTDADYEALEQRYPCLKEGAEPAPTNAPSSLGALAASVQALEARKLLLGDAGSAAIGKEVVIDALHHTHYLTKLTRNPKCLFDHQTWQLTKVGSEPRELTIGEALALWTGAAGGNGSVSLRVENQTFVRELHCPECGCVSTVFRLRRRLTPEQATCVECKKEMVPNGRSAQRRLTVSNLSPETLQLSLESVGFCRGDVFILEDEAEEEHQVLLEGKEQRNG